MLIKKDQQNHYSQDSQKFYWQKICNINISNSIVSKIIALNIPLNKILFHFYSKQKGSKILFSGIFEAITKSSFYRTKTFLAPQISRFYQ